MEGMKERGREKEKGKREGGKEEVGRRGRKGI